MTTNTNAATWTDKQYLEQLAAHYQHSPVPEIRSHHERLMKIAAALTTAAAVPPEGWVMVPVELAERVQESLGEFLMDHGWSQRDMDTSDEFGAVLLAAAPKAEPVPAGEYPPLPEWSKMDNLGGLVPSEIRQELRAYVDSDRALRAQAAPAAVAVRESFDADGFKEWVKRNLPDDTIIGSSEWWANHLTLWAQRFFTVSAAPQPPAQVQEPFGYFRAEPFGWTDCAADEDGAKALYEHPAPQPAPVAQGDAMTYEREHAIRQGHEIASSDAYFQARPQIDGLDRRNVFRAGFERGWDAARSQAKEGA